MTLALVSSRRNSRSRAQTSISTIENQHFLVQMAPQASWPPDVPAESLEARRSQPGVLSQASSARIPQPGVLSQDSLARNLQPAVSSQSVWGPRWSHFENLDFLIFPQTELAMRGSYGLGKGPLKHLRGHSSFILIRKNRYLVTLAQVCHKGGGGL